MMMKRLSCLLVGLAAATCASAAALTMNFTADGFANAGTQYPGYSGPISGSISWIGGASLSDPISVLTDIHMTIAGHAYSLGEIGIANQGSTQTAIGGLWHGANAVVGDGSGNDFLLVFDRVHPGISAFAYSIEGKTDAIWWTPSSSHAEFAAAETPEPASFTLALLGLAAGFGLRRRSR